MVMIRFGLHITVLYTLGKCTSILPVRSLTIRGEGATVRLGVMSEIAAVRCAKSHDDVASIRG
jgi:hypothetical protein